MFDTDILRSLSQNIFGVLKGDFLWFWVSKRHPDALLAKTMLMPLVCTGGSYMIDVLTLEDIIMTVILCL